MIKPAHLYREEVTKKYIETWYDLEYMYYSGWFGNGSLNIPDDNYESHHFVSIHNDKVIGYITYSVNCGTMNAENFGAISFDKGNPVFASDLYQVICDIFEKYHMNRLGWSCIVGNPAMRGYKHFVEKHGGKECGYRRQVAKLMDGKLHDSVEFEILASEFKR